MTEYYNPVHRPDNEDTELLEKIVAMLGEDSQVFAADEDFETWEKHLQHFIDDDTAAWAATESALVAYHVSQGIRVDSREKFFEHADRTQFFAASWLEGFYLGMRFAQEKGL